MDTNQNSQNNAITSDDDYGVKKPVDGTTRNQSSDSPKDDLTTSSSAADDATVQDNKASFPFKPIGDPDASPKQEESTPKSDDVTDKSDDQITKPVISSPKPAEDSLKPEEPPSDPAEPNQKEDPQIDVNLEKKQTEAPQNKSTDSISIEVPDYESPKPVDNHPIQQPPAAPPPQNPVPKVNDYQPSPDADNNKGNIGGGHARSAVIYTLVALLFIGLGFLGGMGLNKYDKFASLFSTSADTDSVKNTSDITKPTNTSATPGSSSVWPKYTSTKNGYSVKYPDNYYAKGLTTDGSSITFTSYDPEITTNTGTKIQITSQPANGKTLQDWIIAANTTAGNANAALTPSTVAGTTAYQQTTSGASESISTYLLINTNVITLTYSAPVATFKTDQTIYNEILKSLQI